MTKILKLLWCVALGLSLGIVEAAKAGDYTFQRIDISGATQVAAFGINDSNQIVGFYVDVAGISHGFGVSNGVTTVFDVPGSNRTVVYGINNNGDIVGSYGDATGSHAFVYSDDYITFDVPDSGSTFASGINDSSQIVGSYVVAGRTHGFLMDEFGNRRRP